MDLRVSGGKENPLKGKIALINLLSTGAGIGIVLLSMYALTDGPRGWAAAHAMGWIIWVVDISAVCIAGLMRLAGIYYWQNEIAREEHQSQLERTIQQSQHLEQENELLCEQLEELEAQISNMEQEGFAPQALEEARERAERLKHENTELRESLDVLARTNSELEARLMTFETRFIESDAALAKALARIAELERVQVSASVAHPTTTSPRSVQAALSLVQQLEQENMELADQVRLLEEQHSQSQTSLHRSVVDLKEKNRDLQTQVEQVSQKEKQPAMMPLSERLVETLLHEIENVLTNLPNRIAAESASQDALELVLAESESRVEQSEESQLAVVSAQNQEQTSEALEEDEDLIYLNAEDWRRPSRPVARRIGGGRPARRLVRR